MSNNDPNNNRSNDRNDDADRSMNVPGISTEAGNNPKEKPKRGWFIPLVGIIVAGIAGTIIANLMSPDNKNSSGGKANGDRTPETRATAENIALGFYKTDPVNMPVYKFPDAARDVKYGLSRNSCVSLKSADILKKEFVEVAGSIKGEIYFEGYAKISDLRRMPVEPGEKVSCKAYEHSPAMPTASYGEYAPRQPYSVLLKTPLRSTPGGNADIIGALATRTCVNIELTDPAAIYTKVAVPSMPEGKILARGWIDSNMIQNDPRCAL